MNKKEINNNNQYFTEGPILGKLLKFMLPILGALILQAMYGAVDLFVVGHFGTKSGISGVTTGSSIMNLVTFVICSFTTAVTVLIGRYIGEKNEERIGKLIGNALTFFVTVAIAVSVLLLFFAEPFARLMQAPEEALSDTVTYIRVCSVGYVFIVMYNFISSIFRGLGNSRLPLLFVAIACGVNIVGDLVLIALLDMNVKGAAIATVVAQAVSVILSLIIIKRRKLVRLTRQDFGFGEETKRIVKLGAPLGFQEALTHITFMALCAFINRLGIDASSGYGIAQKIQSFVMLIPSALMQCMAPFVAQNVGAGKDDRSKKSMLTGMGIGAFIGVFVGLSVFFFGDVMAAAFDDDPAVVARAFEFLRGFAPEAVVTCILFSFMGYFNGYSKTLFVMFQGLAQSFLVRLPMSYIMSIKPDASLTGIGLAAPTATVFGIVICFVYYRICKKKNSL